jgi:glycosyltransferase involved in cell wall biosynthesis
MSRNSLSRVPGSGLPLEHGAMPDRTPCGVRVAHVIGSAAVGGAERMVVNLLNELAYLRPVLILTQPGDSHDLLDELDPRVEVVRSPCRLSRLPRDIRRLGMHLRSRQINVLHSHMFWPNLFAALAVGVGRVPVFVTTEHGRNPWKQDWHRWIERNLISRRALLRICVSADIRALRASSDGVPASKLIVLPNGTTIPSAQREPMHAVPRLLAVGRLIEAKDYPTLLRAVRVLRERGTRFSLRIAGEGPLLDTLRQLTAAEQLDEHVQWLGNRRDVPALMAESDVFVMTSVREGLPMVLLEAMAMAMPIVATAVGGIPAAVSHECEALLAEPANVDALAASLERLLRDPGFARALGERARRRAARDYSIEAAARRHMSCYEGLLQGVNA